MRLPFLLLHILAGTLISLPAYPATAPNFWLQQAQIVCQKLSTAHQAYLQGDLQQAHVNALMAYFQAYDQKIEPAIRMNMGQARVFQTEQAFNKFNASIVEHPTQQQLDNAKTQAQDLCHIITADARALDAKQIKPQLYEVNQ